MLINDISYLYRGSKGGVKDVKYIGDKDLECVCGNITMM